LQAMHFLNEGIYAYHYLFLIIVFDIDYHMMAYYSRNDVSVFLPME